MIEYLMNSEFYSNYSNVLTWGCIVLAVLSVFYGLICSANSGKNKIDSDDILAISSLVACALVVVSILRIDFLIEGRIDTEYGYESGIKFYDGTVWIVKGSVRKR